MKKIFVVVLFLMAITACQPSEEIIQKAITETEAAKPIETVIPSTETPENTATSTKAPTSTNKPTSTINSTIEPTAIPDPIEIKGNGDDVVDLDWAYGVALVEITGNPNSNHFAVISYGDDNEYLDLLANTSEVYSGTKLINLENDEIVKRFEVNASGDWLITVKPINEVRTAEVPGEIIGIGDDVFVIPSKNCDKLEISGNESSKHFAVIAHSLVEGWNLLVNTSEPYRGSVLCPKQTLIIEVTSSMELWTIKLK